MRQNGFFRHKDRVFARVITNVPNADMIVELVMLIKLRKLNNVPDAIRQ